MEENRAKPNGFALFALLTGMKSDDIIFFDLKKALKRTLFGKVTREKLPLAASSFCRNRKQSPPWSRPPICRLGRTPHVTEVTSDGDCRKQGGTVEYVFVSHP